MDTQTLFNTSETAQFHHILSGSFRSLSLFLLAFSPLHHTLDLVQRVDAFGPHQYLAVNQRRDRVYTTSWALPPSLSSWTVKRLDESPWSVEHLNTVPVTATSSYISLPPPYKHLYSAGGPTGEVHLVDESTGGFAERVQQFLFVPEDELDAADKTRVALRYGSHAVELSPHARAFVPVLGTNTINMYAVDRDSGQLTLLSENQSPRSGDGPRHVVVSLDGSVLYSVTEHTNFLDVYAITDTSLTHIQSQSLLSPSIRSDPHAYRGDTLRLIPSTSSRPSPTHIFATTRGAKPGTHGWLCVLELDERTGLLKEVQRGTEGEGADEHVVQRWETPSSGGKANAIELLAKADSDEGVWIVLTDDDQTEANAGVRILEWDRPRALTSSRSGRGRMRMLR
ncbi:hypothetical protein EW146_g2239 [Bondarzewia mesenterica]|uniref:Muconate cycloisomerase 1 n=1 Tax=Bondarzewia mesenterica TaxID=1095465 RepID=A0A4S4M7J5_9AGAM|nr:hypothetical protein EW146_g2239 [Bondarzewia mesenterica]